MDFVKTHLVSLICGVVALVAIVVAVLGALSDSVTREMDRIKLAAGEIRSLQSDPKNEEIIRAEEERGKAFAAQFENTLKTVDAINKREVVVSGVFPHPANLSAPRVFQYEYKEALRRLPSELLAGDVPSELEIQDEAENVAELLRREAEEKDEGRTERPIGERLAPPAPGGGTRVAPGGRAAPPIVAGPPGAGRPFGPGGGRMGGPGLMGEGAMAPMYTPTAAPTTEPKYDPVQRAWITKARSIRCYASLDLSRVSFHVSPVATAETTPRPEEMWYAQVSLWIQQDLVRAIAALNNEAARKITDADADVSHMPVKRLVATRVHGYVTPEGGLIPFEALSGSSGGLSFGPGGTIPPSFTGRKSDEQFDVVRFTTVLVVDQRDLLAVIDTISKANFYQLVGLSFARVDPSDQSEAAYLYGADPVVRATLDFEGYFARRAYWTLMPPEVRQLLGEKPQG